MKILAVKKTRDVDAVEAIINAPFEHVQIHNSEFRIDFGRIEKIKWYARGSVAFASRFVSCLYPTPRSPRGYVTDPADSVKRPTPSRTRQVRPQFFHPLVQVDRRNKFSNLRISKLGERRIYFAVNTFAVIKITFFYLFFTRGVLIPNDDNLL